VFACFTMPSRALVVCLGVLRAASQAVVSVDLAAPLTDVKDTYVSFNIDTGSLFNDFDFTDATLSQLVKNLASAAPTQLRFGGGAANDVTYTGANGARGNCSSGGVTRICIDDTLWSAVNAFVARTGVELVWDLSILPRTVEGAWNASNSAALIARTASQGYPVTAWQLGNEEGAYVRASGCTWFV
jgi:hypothetical protein